MNKKIPFPEIVEVLSDGCKLMTKLPSSHPDAVFFNVIGHYLTRMSCSIQTLKKIDYYNSNHSEENTSHQDYQVVLSTMRAELEASVDVHLILQNPADAEKVKDWEFCVRTKTGNRVIQEFGNNIPNEFGYKSAAEWSRNNQSNITTIKAKYGWTDVPNNWHGNLIDGIHSVVDVRHKNIFLKEYLSLYSLMNWGTHGSGTIIQSSFSSKEVSDMIISFERMISCSVITTMMSVLAHPKINFLNEEIARKCDILYKYMSPNFDESP